MIIYGSKATEIANEQISDKCSSCGTANGIQMVVFQKYAHVFWIPLFPIGKTAVTQCGHCKQVLQKKEFTSDLNRNYEAVKSNGKTPIWTFSGLAILSILIVWGVISGKQKDEKNAQLILAPQKGDVYEIKKDYKQYTLYKVDNIANDTVFVLLNEYESNKLSGLSDIKSKGDEAYVPVPVPVLKAKLKTMLDNGEIVDVDRK